MGISGISPGSLLLILLILVFIMGGKRLRNLGEDLGIAYKSFKKAFDDDKLDTTKENDNQSNNGALLNTDKK